MDFGGKTDFLKHPNLFHAHHTDMMIPKSGPQKGADLLGRDIIHESPPLPDDVCLGGSTTWIRSVDPHDAISDA